MIVLFTNLFNTCMSIWFGLVYLVYVIKTYHILTPRSGDVAQVFNFLECLEFGALFYFSAPLVRGDFAMCGNFFMYGNFYIVIMIYREIKNPSYFLDN